MRGKWLDFSGQQFPHLSERKKTCVSGTVAQTPTFPQTTSKTLDKTSANSFLFDLKALASTQKKSDSGGARAEARTRTAIGQL